MLTLLCRIVCAALAVALFAPVVLAATDCSGREHIRLTRPVHIDPDVRQTLQAAAPLHVVAVDAPPMVRYHTQRRAYEGIAVDILCFIAAELDIPFVIEAGRDETVYDKLQQVQKGEADVFIPLSYSEERAQQGLFTDSFYSTYYAIIARHNSGVVVRSINDLPNYRVGYVQGVVLEPVLKALMPAERLIAFNDTTSDSLFDALLDGTIDLVMFSKDVFHEKRFHNEYFDLEAVYTLYEYPRTYRFYFSSAPEHTAFVEVFNQYLAALDIAASVNAHRDGERTLLERYIAQRDQRTLLMFTSIAGVLLILLMTFALLRHRRLTRLLNAQNRQIEEQRRTLHETNRKLEALTRTDALTQLPNRRYFDARLNKAYARNRHDGTPVSVLVIDIDRFKSVNDQYGHPTGDAYLKQVARALERSVDRDTADIARYGGEEFVCLLQGDLTRSAVGIADRMRREVEQMRLANAGATPPWVTISVGVATIAPGACGDHDLMKLADEQLYRAKQEGRNRVCSIEVGGGRGAA